MPPCLLTGGRINSARFPEVLAYHAHVHLLGNSAGVSLAGPLESVSIEDLEWVFGINFWGTVYGCRCFLPILRKEPRAQIANILSDFALLGFPTKSAYCATKFAGRGFTEALRAELHGTGVGVTAVYPGPASTGLVKSGRACDPAWQAHEHAFLQRRGLTPAVVSERMLRGIECDSARVLIGWETHVMDAMTRLCPSLTAEFVARLRAALGFA